MIDGNENFLSRKKNEEGKLGLRWETNTGYEARLVFSLVHGHTVNHTAVSLRKDLFISNQKKSERRKKIYLKSCSYFDN